jgi:hypothetical protein
MKFLCLAYEEEAALNELSHPEWDALRIETLAYVEMASTLRVRDGNLAVTDGPYAETREQLGGFFLIEARDRGEAIELASRWPSARLGSIEVRPIEEVLREESRY